MTVNVFLLKILHPEMVLHFSLKYIFMSGFLAFFT